LGLRAYRHRYRVPALRVLGVMPAFFAWLESLDLIEGVLLYCFVCTVLSTIIYVVDRWFATREIRAIRRRVWAEKKARVDKQIAEQRERERRKADDAEFVRRLSIDVGRDDLQSRREARQFHLSPAFRDFKGITKL
jgi:uncharacterized membrane protein